MEDEIFNPIITILNSYQEAKHKLKILENFVHVATLTRPTAEREGVQQTFKNISRELETIDQKFFSLLTSPEFHQKKNFQAP